MENYLQMLRWMRPSRSSAVELFCEIYLEPVFDTPDVNDNYVKIVYNQDGSEPNLCFTAHSDTVHQTGGIQDLRVEGNFIFSVGNDCLGADCTTGVWLILEMIEAKIPGVYVIHADEEVGCIGSRSMLKDPPAWVSHIDAVISFDRKGTKDIVTHQIGTRTCSDAFARSLSLALDMPQLVPDDTGVYTDSNEYIDHVGECTNLSVGYFAQHTQSECQDAVYLMGLRDKLLAADWSKLVFSRQPMEYDDTGWYNYQSKFDRGPSGGIDYEKEELLYLVNEYPEDIAEYLYNLGFTSDAIAEELGIESNGYLSRFLDADMTERKMG